MNFCKARHCFLVALLTVACINPVHALEPDKIFEMVSPSIVLIVAPTSERSFNQGSGVVVAPEIVVTNCHVLKKAKTISVKRGQEYLQAQLQYPDVERDLCQIKVPELKAPPVKIGTMANLRIGQRVYALGNPEGLELTFSEGLFSALRGNEGNKRIQISATITHGSSGGGLFDDQGRLIGITSSGLKDGALGLNFAIPADYVAELPKRGSEALASLDIKPGAVKPLPKLEPESQQKSPEAPATKAHRKLGSNEILAQFKAGSEFQANEQGQPFALKVLESGIWVRRYCPGCKVNFGDGRLRLDPDAGNVCMDFAWVTYPDSGCYAVFQTDASHYLLEPLNGGHPILYRVIN